jgi:hypothetical protein
VATVAELQARLDQLRVNRALGALSVRYEDGTAITYRSDAELAAAIADLERQITVTSGVGISTIRVGSSKGFDS